MAAELREAPAAVRRQADSLAAPLTELAARLAGRPPDVVVTCARGSSAHAAAFAKHLIERHVGIPVAAAAPNIATIYRRPLRLRGQLLLTISQSGSSDDLIEMTGAARAAGALTVAIVNEPESALASASEVVLPMAAGPELSVAATKTFIASLAAVLRLAARWSGGIKMLEACERLPDRLDEAARLDWSEALKPLARSEQSRRHRARPDFGHRAGGSSQAQGNLRAARRGVQQCRVSAWSDCADIEHLPHARIHAGR